MDASLSDPIDELIGTNAAESVITSTDVAIVGSGYGASMAALRLAGPGRKVLLLERGREYALGEFPADMGELPRHVRFQRASDPAPVGYVDALFDFRIGEGIDVLVGSGLGGTSLINANVAAEPDAAVLSDVAWPDELREPGALAPHFEAVRKLLGVATIPGLAKYDAMEKLATALGARCSPAPITVTTSADGSPVRNAVGIDQAACTLCGNCVTGCNVGAKNTLMMNALPLARSRGARLYTEATVLSVLPSGDPAYPWELRLKRTASLKTPMERDAFRIRAQVVVLAAGTLGSTEILLRSREAGGGALRVSPLLGTRFSANGDAIAFGYAQRAAVNAVGARDAFVPARVGPTITGIAHPTLAASDGRKKSFTLEDGAVPWSLRRLFEEVLATAGMAQRLGTRELPAWHRDSPNVDPLSIAPGARDHSQLLLLMGDDGAAGCMRLRPDAQRPDASDFKRLVVEWPQQEGRPDLQWAAQALRAQDRGTGFDGGQYVPNPLWQLLPEGAADVMSGPAPGGRAVTVHPLGGCPMGEHFESGVVNHLGQVFREGTDVNEGLYVLDGSIVPRALGTNPFLTIAALALRGAGEIARARQWDESSTGTAQPVASIAGGRRPALSEDKPTHVVLRERLVGSVRDAPPWFHELHPKGLDPMRRWTEDKGMILDIEMDLPDLDAWLQAGPSTPLRVNPQGTRLCVNRVPAELTLRSRMSHVPDDHIGPDDGVAYAEQGQVTLLAADRPGSIRLWFRAGLAILAYFSRRGIGLGGQGLRGIPGFIAVALQHAIYRRLAYDIRFRTAAGFVFWLRGEKTLAWRPGVPRVWDSLFALDFDLAPKRGRSVRGRVEVDSRYLATTGAPQVVSAPNLPEALAALSSVAALFARSIFQTHFWDFGAPDYPKVPIVAPSTSPPLNVGSARAIEPVTTQLRVPLNAQSSETVALRLTRYPQPEGAAGALPVLLVHGLAQGSRIFSQDMLPTNMAAFLWRKGYDVWLLDYRLSNLFGKPLPAGTWSIDEIGAYDLPAAVAQVHEATGKPVRLFAHCVGATSTAMGILAGRIAPGQLACVAFNAIHPWIMPSAVNDFRAVLGTFFRNVLGDGPLDPIPSRNPSAAEVLFDRLAFSFARYGEMPGDAHEREAGIENAVCDRMSLLYGRMWWHANLDPRTHAAFPQVLGPAPGAVYRHLYYFSVRHRLTDAEGLNTYLTDSNLARWTVPTFFLHGEQSLVFNPQSATRSHMRLDAVLNPAGKPATVPIGSRRFEGYGHMCVVFGKEAEHASFATLAEFFADPSRAAQIGRIDPRDADVHMRSVRALTCGPVLRAAWIADGKVKLRLWGEHAEEVTSLVDGLSIAEPSDNVQPGDSRQIAEAEPRYHFIDATVSAPGDVSFRVEANDVGSGVSIEPPQQVTARLAGAAAKPQSKPADLPGRPKTVYEAGLPWLQRLRAAAASGTPVSDMRFLVGSCRYPGTPFERERADAVFAGMERHADDHGNLRGAHLQFFIGDQIYADATANMLDSTPWRERYCDQYRRAFTSPHMAALLQRLPTHFAIDDHEIKDDWSGELASDAEAKLALRAAGSFMSSARDQVPVGASAGPSLWYALDEAAERCCPTFIMDTRSQRRLRMAASGTSAAMIDAAQLEALSRWLDAARVHAAEAPKFIIAGTGIAPIARDWQRHPSTWRSNDNWLGYPDTAARICALIVSKGVQNVVFISGDLHFSCASRLVLEYAGTKVPCWHLVSSGLYCPMPFANAHLRDYDWDREVAIDISSASPASRVRVTAESFLLASGPPHFLRVDAEHTGTGWSLAFGAFDERGNAIAPGRLPAWAHPGAAGMCTVPLQPVLAAAG